MIDLDQLHQEADRLASLDSAGIRREAVFRALLIGEQSRVAQEQLLAIQSEFDCTGEVRGQR